MAFGRKFIQFELLARHRKTDAEHGLSKSFDIVQTVQASSSKAGFQMVTVLGRKLKSLEVKWVFSP
jgi:hypothetical protein